MTVPYGEIAALGTALCWTVSSLAFSAAGQRIGSLALNLIRLVMAFGYLVAFCWIRRGLPLPTDATSDAWAWLSLSGLVGFVLGDLCLFRAFLLIGPRLSMLVMSLAPPITALTGWLLLGETLTPLDWGGMMLTLSGVAWVVLEKGRSEGEIEGDDSAKAHPRSGLALAFLGAVGQAVGLVLSKLGMKDYDPFAATQIRVIAGTLGIAALFFALRWWGRVLKGVRHREGMALAALGAFAGPFLGVSLSLIAVQRAQTGVVATIMATVPVLIIPVMVLVYKEKVSTRAVLGAVVAVGGVALLWHP